MEVVSVHGNVENHVFMELYQQALEALKKERAVSLVRVRNQIIKDFKFDIKELIPEIAKAVAYLDVIQGK
jgi:hypothetical protein